MGNCCPPATNVEEDNNKGGNDDTVKTKMLGNESGQKTEEMMRLLVNSSDGEERCALDFPRMHFYGVFRSNTGTGNNMIGNYKLAMEYESGKGEHEITSSAGNKGGGYLYNGDMTYNWTNCKITAAYDKDGEEDTKTYQHFEINPSSKQVSGRLNDLGAPQFTFILLLCAVLCFFFVCFFFRVLRLRNVRLLLFLLQFTICCCCLSIMICDRHVANDDFTNIWISSKHLRHKE